MPSKKQLASPTWRAFSQMQKRCICRRPDVKAVYADRGIAVCDRWRGVGGYGRFIADMGERPSAAHSVDRIDNDKGYSPDNCRWATPQQQQRNRRAVKLNEETVREIIIGKYRDLSQGEVARMFGMNQGTISRIRAGKRWPDVADACRKEAA